MMKILSIVNDPPWIDHLTMSYFEPKYVTNQDYQRPKKRATMT